MIISTNIAETSITITGIKYVVDTGMVKAKKYNPGENLWPLASLLCVVSGPWSRSSPPEHFTSEYQAPRLAGRATKTCEAGKKSPSVANLGTEGQGPGQRH